MIVSISGSSSSSMDSPHRKSSRSRTINASSNVSPPEAQLEMAGTLASWPPDSRGVNSNLAYL